MTDLSKKLLTEESPDVVEMSPSQTPFSSQSIHSIQAIPEDVEASMRGLEPVGEVSSKNKLTTFMGVYVPCCLSMFGIVLFQRLGWIVGYAGLWWSLGMLALAEVVVILTVLSMSAISTNGSMKGGGSYYMISRALGPEFGGAIGIIFYAANLFAAAFYLRGLGDTILQTFVCKDTHPTGWLCDIGEYHSSLLLATALLLLVVAIAIAGAEWFARSALLIFCIIFISVWAGFFSFLAAYPTDTKKHEYGYVGIKHGDLSRNLGSCYADESCKRASNPKGQNDFFILFAIFFNAVTGVNAGANMSGDLANPGRAIPVGTLGAIFTTIVVYGIYMVVIAAAFHRDRLVDSTFGYLVMQHVCVWPPLVYVGLIVSLFAGALSSLVGAARILQAVARDKVLPGMGWLAYGSVKGDEPRPAVLLSWLLIQGAMFIKTANAVGEITTISFLLSYAAINFACFALRITGAPNFRPVFRYFSWHTALVGTIISIVIMFLIKASYAAGSVALCLMIVLYINWRAPQSDWGDISQALIYHQVRKYLLLLDHRREHVKFWRPGVLLFAADPDESDKLLQLANVLKKGGVYVIGSVLKGERLDVGHDCKTHQQAWQEYVSDTKIKAFADVVIAPSLQSGVTALLLTAGLGGMKPNCVIFGFPNPKAADDETPSRPRRSSGTVFPKTARLLSLSASDAVNYVGMLADAVFFDKNVLISRHVNTFDQDMIDLLHKNNEVKTWAGYFGFRPRHKTRDRVRSDVDVWILPDIADMSEDAADTYRGSPFIAQDPCASVCMQLASIISRYSGWDGLNQMRLIALCSSDTPAHEVEARMSELEEMKVGARVTAECEVFALPCTRREWLSQTPSERHAEANRLIAARSTNTLLSFLTIPRPPEQPPLRAGYMTNLDALSAATLPPTLLVYGASVVIATEL